MIRAITVQLIALDPAWFPAVENPGSLRFGGSIVRLTGFLGPRPRGQLAYLGADRLERPEFVLLWAKLVGIGSVWSVDRLLKPHGKIR